MTKARIVIAVFLFFFFVTTIVLYASVSQRLSDFGNIKLLWIYDKAKMDQYDTIDENLSRSFAPAFYCFINKNNLYTITQNGELNNYKKKLKPGEMIEQLPGHFFLTYHKVGHRVRAHSYYGKKLWSKKTICYPFFVKSTDTIAFLNSEHSSVFFTTGQSKQISPLIDCGDYITGFDRNRSESLFSVCTLGSKLYILNNFKILWRQIINPHKVTRKLTNCALSSDGKYIAVIDGASPQKSILKVIKLDTKKSIIDIDLQINFPRTTLLKFISNDVLLFRSGNHLICFNVTSGLMFWRIPITRPDLKIDLAYSEKYYVVILQNLTSTYSFLRIYNRKHQLLSIVKVNEPYLKAIVKKGKIYCMGKRYISAIEIQTARVFQKTDYEYED